MEPNRRSQPCRVLPKHLSDGFTSVVSSKKARLTNESQGQENATETVIEIIARYSEAEDSSNNSVPRSDMVDFSKNSVHVEFIQAPTSNDHFYCKKNENDEIDSSSVNSSIENSEADMNICDRKTDDSLNLQLSNSQPVKRKRGRPPKNVASPIPQIKENEKCCICDEKFVLSAIRSYRRFGLYTFLHQLGASPVQMINRLIDDPQKIFSESDEKKTSNVKQFLCYQCFSNLRGAYTTLVSFKDKMQSFVGRINPHSAFKEKFFMKDPVKNDIAPQNLSSESVFRLCNDLDVKHAKISFNNKSCQTDSDDCTETRHVKPKKLTASSISNVLNSIPCEEVDKYLVKCIYTKNFNAFFKYVLRHPELKKHYITFLKSQIMREINDGINNKSSILLQSFCEESVHQFGWKQLQDEMETMLPTLTAVLKSAIFNKSLLNAIEKDDVLSTRSEEDFLRKTICLGNTMANILYLNNKKMCLVQEANSVMMFHAGCTNWMMQTFHHLGFCVPSKLVKPYIDLRRQVKDARMVKWRKKITKPHKGIKVFSYAFGGISAKDLDTDDGSTQLSKDSPPKDCKVVYIQGIKTSVCLQNFVESFIDSDEEHEDELKLPKLLGEKYERECVSSKNLPNEGHSAEDTITTCQNALDNALCDLRGDEKFKDPNLLCDDSENQTEAVELLQPTSVKTETYDAEHLKTLFTQAYSHGQNEPNIVQIIADEQINGTDGKSIEFLKEDSAERMQTFETHSSDSSKILFQNSEKFPEIAGGEVVYLVMDNEQSAENILLGLHQVGYAPA